MTKDVFAFGTYDVSPYLKAFATRTPAASYRSSAQGADQQFSWWALEDSNLRPLACKVKPGRSGVHRRPATIRILAGQRPYQEEEWHPLATRVTECRLTNL